jgi:hypothetical protein
MKRISQIPFEEISILSLANVTPGTKFQLFGKVKELKDDSLLLSDEINEFSLAFETKDLLNVKTGDVVLVFGKKEETSIKLVKIIKMNLDWALLAKTRNLELM